VPLVPTFQVDVRELFARINVWDHGCQTPYDDDCPHPNGARTRFAFRLGRHRQSFQNFKTDPSKRIGEDFATQVAEALHVDISVITLPETAETPEAPQPQAAVRKAA
jgi:hypothetical protein